MAIVIDTIQALIDHDEELTMWCDKNHSRKVDLQKLGNWLGFDHSIMHDDLTPKLWCPTCGSRKIGIILTSGKAKLMTLGGMYPVEKLLTTLGTSALAFFAAFTAL
jgi:hypothetical protein